jgi:hypothetical protein
VIDLQAMLADLELLVNTESPSLDVPLLTPVGQQVLASVMEAAPGFRARHHRRARPARTCTG